MSKTSSILSAAQLAALFTQLKQLDSAGLPAFQAFDILAKNDTRLKTPLALVQRQLKSGRPISDACYRAGIFSDTLRALIQAAEASGRMSEVYGRLAEHYTALSARSGKIKSRLVMPALVLTIALFVQPLPALVGAQISLGGYLQLSLGRLLVIAAAAFLLLRLPQLFTGLPFVAQRITDRQMNGFFQVLAMLLEVGLPFAEALPKAVATIENAALRVRFAPALAMLGSGASVTDTLCKVDGIDATMLQVVHSSEQSGRLAGGILQYAKIEAETLDRQDDAWAAWLPRVAYTLVALWMAYSILFSPLGSGAAAL
jgi:general secretion pathway protein F